MDALRLYVHLGDRLRVPPADGLAERVRTACQLGNLWAVNLNEEQIRSVAYAFYLRSMGGSVAEANRFARQYGAAFRLERPARAVADVARPCAPRDRRRGVSRG
ncbi:DUF6417 family protein [Streptomyces echinatus]|uniref:DUF6417 family protein n=1 Tax=Streptomyces echinatus TaxID=67293 RepID=UPI003821626F